jgi:AcrR family transcriptional regulator
MARNPEATRAALLAAALDEFSEHGYSGSRIERISARSAVNRERIYAYFGGKQGLFEATLSEQLSSTLDGVPVNGTGVEAIVGFALDYYALIIDDPRLARLIHWEGLELENPIDLGVRTARASGKVDELRAAHPGMSCATAEYTLLTIVTLSHACTATPNVRSVVLGADARPDRDRSIIAAATAAAAAQPLAD